MATLQDLHDLLPTNTVGSITAQGLRDVVTALWSKPERTRNVWAMGDSLTIGAGTGGGGLTAAAHATDTAQPFLLYQAGCWEAYALLSSEARWTFAGVAATAGYTVQQIHDVWLPVVLARAQAGDTVVVLAGTNQISAEGLTVLQSIHTQLLAAGLNPVAVSIPPNEAATPSQVFTFNSGLQQFCAGLHIPFVDIHSILVNPLDGTWDEAYYGDAQHPNGLGFKTMGVAIAQVLNSFFDEPVPLTSVNVDIDASFQKKALGLDTPTQSANFLIMGGTGAVVDFPTDARFAGDSAYRFTYGSSGIVARMTNAELVAGQRIRIGAAIETSGSGWQFLFTQNTSGARLAGFGYPGFMGQSLAQDLGRFYIDLVIPEGLPAYTNFRMDVGLNGGTLLLGENTYVDLDA